MASGNDIMRDDAAWHNVAAAQDPFVTLDVGGRRFRTLRDTLTKESAYFKTLLSEPNSPYVQPDGSYYIDADPDVFPHILYYIRCSTLPLFWSRTAGFDYSLYQRLQKEAEFFQLHTVAKWIQGQLYLEAVSVITETREVAWGSKTMTSSELAGDVEYQVCKKLVSVPFCTSHGSGCRFMSCIDGGRIKIANEEKMFLLEVKRRLVFNRKMFEVPK